MANILRHPRATLADVQCTRLVFQPGDRILVKVYHHLDKDQEKKLRRTVQKWAGVDVRIHIVCALDMELIIEPK